MTADSVDTVRGPVPLNRLGQTLIHEHVFELTPDVMANYDGEWWDEEERISDAVEKLNALKPSGIDRIVDPTVLGLGRYIPRIQQMNEQADINIVVAGLYTFDETPHYFHYRGPGALFGGPESMRELFVRDLTQGIGDTGMRAAFLECVVEERVMMHDQERVQAAICAAHAQTGAPITVHTNAENWTGRIVLGFYRQHGVDLAKVATVVALCAGGYADRIVLAHDASCYIDFFSGKESQAQLQATVPNWNYQHIPLDVLPALREAGVTDAQIRTMLIDNPSRYFTGTNR